MARLRRAEDDLDAALVLVGEAVQVYVGDYTPSLRPVPAVRARLQIYRGELSLAAGWVTAAGVSAEDDLTLLREYEHITLVRLLLAQYALGQRDDAKLRDGLSLLNRLLAAAEAGRRGGSVLEILVLLARAHQLRRDPTTARDCLARAVTLGETDGFVRVFADEGDALAPLLTALAKQSDSRYVRRLVAATGTRAIVASPTSLVVPLSDRELDVLRLLGSDLGGPAIARELSVSLNTLRTHTKSIFAKLGVNSRRDAVRQAAELHLLSRTPDR
ncbi:MAG: hypothetical protein H0X35_11300 [Pseudonocardiales bacterium]|nr:hypothetical protein [Pseudonocardiales bacterium]